MGRMFPVESEVERAFFEAAPAHGSGSGDQQADFVDEPDASDTRARKDDSRYSRLGRRAALGLLALLLLAMGWFFAAATLTTARSQEFTAVAAEPIAEGDSDADLYHAISDRVHAGEGYYAAAGSELRKRGYPTRPVFNWRQPTCAWVLAHVPFPAAVLTLLGAVMLLMTLRWLRDAWGQVAAIAVCVFHMAALPHSGDAVYYHEVWAGSLVILSATAYGLGRWRWGMLALLAALAFREFVLLPVAVAVVFALYERRRSELLAWAVALPLYAGLWALHFAAVSRHLGPADQLLPPRSWLAFGGAHFLILATRVDMLWFYLPSFVNALALPMALFGYGDWRNTGATRMGLTLLGFMLAFSVIGLPCNGYWGFLFLPLLSIGLVRFPRALQELVGAIRRPALLASSDQASSDFQLLSRPDGPRS
jgi:hypothetical protein